MAGECCVSLPGGVRVVLIDPPVRHRVYVARVLGRCPERGPVLPAALTVRFVARLPRSGRVERIGEFAGWSGGRFWVGDLRGARLAWSPECPLREEWCCERGYAPDALWAYLWWALRAAWREQSAVMLHASAAVLDGQAVTLMGWSGAGKSTVLRELLGRGAGFLGDDWVLLAPGRVERCSVELRMPDGRRHPAQRALPGTTVWDAAPLAATCLLTTVEGGTIAQRPWDAQDTALRMAACLRYEGAVFAHACDAYRFFRPDVATPFDDTEARDADLLAAIFAATRGSAWSIPRRAAPAAVADAMMQWLASNGE